MNRQVHAVTGAFGYSGSHIARLLLERGERVRTFTGHPDRLDPFGGRVEVARFRFDEPSAMHQALADVRVLYNATARLVGAIVGDVILTRDEVSGLTSNLLVSKGPPTAPTRFSDWLTAHAHGLGVAWGSELRRHYR